MLLNIMKYLFFSRSSMILHVERLSCLRRRVCEVDLKCVFSFELQQTRLGMKTLNRMMVALVRNGSNKGTTE